MGCVGQHSDHDPLNECVNHRADHERSEEREGSVAAGVFGLAHGRQRGFKSSIGEYQQQYGLQPLAGGDGCGPAWRDCGGMRVQPNNPERDHGEKWHEFRRGKEVADLRSCPHSEHVNEGKHADQDREDERAWQRVAGMRPELAEINHKQIGVGGRRGHLTEEEHPCHLNAHAASEGGARVEVGASRVLKAGSDFGKAADRSRPCRRRPAARPEG